jgi:hypothetical protein
MGVLRIRTNGADLGLDSGYAMIDLSSRERLRQHCTNLAEMKCEPPLD